MRSNYENARRGSIEIGAGRNGAPLDHQVAWYAADGSWHEWAEFETRAQYSQHPVGLPLLLAALLYPLHGTVWVEHFAIVLTAAGTFVMALFSRRLFRTVSESPGLVKRRRFWSFRPARLALFTRVVRRAMADALRGCCARPRART